MGEHWQVVGRVAVCVAALEADVAICRELLHGLVLCLTVQGFANQFAGENSVFALNQCSETAG